MGTRLSRKQLEELTKKIAEQNGLQYGYNKNQVNLAYTDARCAPYLYALEIIVNDGGGTHQIITASTARQIYDALYNGSWIKEAKRQIHYTNFGTWD